MSVVARWVSDMAFENHATIDGRWIAPDALDWRQLPLTLMAMTANLGGGHQGSFVAGRIDTIEKDASLDIAGQPLPFGVTSLKGAGVFDIGGINGAEVARLVSDDMLRGISVDLAIKDFGLRDPETGEVIPKNQIGWDEVERYFNGELQFAILKATLVAATVCPTPAFDDARIGLTASGGECHGELITRFKLVEAEEDAMTAAATAPLKPPRGWFETQEPPGAMPLTITDEGRVFGHIASWDTCHTGLAEVCTRPPRSQSNYAYFHVGEIETEDGHQVTVGKLMFHGKHAPLSMSRSAASQHYDDNTHVGAYVRAMDGQHGIWVAGALRHGLTDAEVAEIRANPPSGDWRPVNGHLELVAALAVPVPGFPIPRAQASIVAAGDELQLTGLLVSSGEVIPHEAVVEAMVSAGVLTESESHQMQKWADARPQASMDVLLAQADDDPIGALVALVE